MEIVFKNKKVEEVCLNTKKAIQKYGDKVGMKLSMIINAIMAADNLLDVYQMPQYRMHALSGDRKKQYSLVISKSSKYRLIVYPLDDNNNIMTSGDNEILMLKTCVLVEIVEVSEHYG